MGELNMTVKNDWPGFRTLFGNAKVQKKKKNWLMKPTDVVIFT